MSVQAIRDFWQKVQQHPALRQQLEELKAEGKDATVAAIVRLAAGAGFAFTAEEYDRAVKEELARRHAAGELADADLSAVAGGEPPPTHPFVCE